jgi:hypothetical protein
MNKLIGVAALAVTLPLITACGDYGAGAEATPTTIAEPTVEIKYLDRDVEVVPEACLEALDVAEEVFDAAAEGFHAAADAFYAAADFDAAGIRAGRRGIEAATAEISELTPRWQSARDECRAAAD